MSEFDLPTRIRSLLLRRSQRIGPSGSTFPPFLVPVIAYPDGQDVCAITDTFPIHSIVVRHKVSGYVIGLYSLSGFQREPETYI